MSDNTDQYEGLALTVTPEAIRQAFADGDDAENPTLDMTDEQLAEVGWAILDGIYDEYRRLLDLAIHDVKHAHDDERDHVDETPELHTVGVTYTFVVKVEDPSDERGVGAAVEEYVHSVSDVFSDPVTIEEIEG